jgi:hypothetical protein
VMPKPAPKHKLPVMVGVRKPYRISAMAGAAFMMANRSLACRPKWRESATGQHRAGSASCRQNSWLAAVELLTLLLLKGHSNNCMSGPAITQASTTAK